MIVKANAEHAAELAQTMGDADRAEVWASGRHTPLRALERGLEVSRDARAWLRDGKVICLFGVGHFTPLSIEASPWMLGSRDLPRYAREFARGSKLVVARWREQYPILRNFVDVRHTVAVRWIGWLGFTLLPAVPYGREGELFHPFESVRHV